MGQGRGFKDKREISCSQSAKAMRECVVRGRLG